MVLCHFVLGLRTGVPVQDVGELHLCQHLNISESLRKNICPSVLQVFYLVTWTSSNTERSLKTICWRLQGPETGPRVVSGQVPDCPPVTQPRSRLKPKHLWRDMKTALNQPVVNFRLPHISKSENHLLPTRIFNHMSKRLGISFFVFSLTLFDLLTICLLRLIPSFTCGSWQPLLHLRLFPAND